MYTMHTMHTCMTLRFPPAAVGSRAATHRTKHPMLQSWPARTLSLNTAHTVSLVAYLGRTGLSLGLLLAIQCILQRHSNTDSIHGTAHHRRPLSLQPDSTQLHSAHRKYKSHNHTIMLDLSISNLSAACSSNNTHNCSRVSSPAVTRITCLALQHQLC